MQRKIAEPQWSSPKPWRVNVERQAETDRRNTVAAVADLFVSGAGAAEPGQTQDGSSQGEGEAGSWRDQEEVLLPPLQEGRLSARTTLLA